LFLVGISEAETERQQVSTSEASIFSEEAGYRVSNPEKSISGRPFFRSTFEPCKRIRESSPLRFSLPVARSFFGLGAGVYVTVPPEGASRSGWCPRLWKGEGSSK